MKNIHKIGKYIYITSDEKINYSNEQWLLVFGWHETYVYYHNEPTTYYNDHKKIILTTDQDLIEDGVQPINYEFLEWFMKNPDCEYVETTLIYDHENHPELPGNPIEKWSFYEVTVPKEMTKQEILKEAASSHADSIRFLMSTYNRLHIQDGFIAGAKWHAERMYSEEEVMYSEEEVEAIVKDSYEMGRKNILIGVFNKWFDQYKKSKIS